MDPVDREYRRRRFRRWAFWGIGLYLVVLLVYWGILAEVPVDYARDDDHFKYGSIGSDTDNGIPYWIWRVMPEMFPEYLPDPEAFQALPESQRDGLAGYAQFGYLLEPGHDTPIGFSQRRDLVTRVGLNCAVCHVSTVRVSGGLDAARIYGSEPAYVGAEKKRAIVLGMPANTVDLEAYFQFLFRCASDGRYTSERVMDQIRARTKLSWKDQLIYKRAVDQVRSMLLVRRRQVSYFDTVPHFGPGRIDTFTPYKVIQFGFSYDGTIGTADFPSNWNQRPREGMQLHWDGNNKSVFERNISASMGAGVTPVSLDMPRMLRVAAWLGSPDPSRSPGEGEIRSERNNPVPRAGELPIPRYPFPIDQGLAETGKAVYDQHCAACHDWNGQYIGQVVPLNDIGTDPYRLDSYTVELSVNQNTLGVGHPWRFHNFRKTQGYANMPLDGLWARAPYLHNGSVPTLDDLLKPASERPQVFLRGNDEYDSIKVGFHSEVRDDYVPLARDRVRGHDGSILFRFDTQQPGNANAGHEYGTSLSNGDKVALLEYLKTL